jgi:uncharacterized protein (TIGR02246 family)
MKPEIIVQQQLVAYNVRDLEAFLATYSEDVEIYNFPNTLHSKGKEELRKSYGKLFEEHPQLHSSILSRVIQYNFVIDKESVTGLLNNDRVLEVVAIYEVRDDLISKV